MRLRATVANSERLNQAVHSLIVQGSLSVSNARGDHSNPPLSIQPTVVGFVQELVTAIFQNERVQKTFEKLKTEVQCFLERATTAMISLHWNECRQRRPVYNDIKELSAPPMESICKSNQKILCVCPELVLGAEELSRSSNVQGIPCRGAWSST